MKNVKAILLLGGLGTRLYPLTKETPKPLLPVKGKPFIFHQIELLKKHGIKEIVLALGYKPKLFRKLLKNGKDLGIKFHYSVEKSSLGTAGALKLASKHITGNVVVLNGDVLADFDIGEILESHGDDLATIVTTEVGDVSKYGAVAVCKSGFVREFIEKPEHGEARTNLINAGCYVLNKKILNLIPSGRPISLEKNIFPWLINKGVQIGTYLHTSEWVDIGTHETYAKVNKK